MFKLGSSAACIRLNVDGGRDRDAVLASLFIQLIQEAYEQGSCSLRTTAELINEIFDVEAERCASTYRFLMSSKRRSSSFAFGWKLKNDETGGNCSHDEIMRRLLEGIQRCSDDLAMIMLCRLLHGYVIHCKHNVSLRRQRRLLRLDATNSLIKALNTYLRSSDSAPLRLVAIDALVALLLVLSSKDRKFALKVRLGGLIARFRTRIFSSIDLCSVTLLRLICKCIRSPRNTQLLVGVRDFAARFVKQLCAFDSSNTSSAMKMARLVDILYFVTKNKKCRAELLNERVVEVVKTLFERHFELRLTDLTHLELCLISVACLRQLSRTKLGRSELMANGMVEICERAICALSEDHAALHGKQDPLIGPLHQLQESLCALCVRCLPLRQFPLLPTSSLPVMFTLPEPSAASQCRTRSTKRSKKSRRYRCERLDNTRNNFCSSDDESDNEENDLFGDPFASDEVLGLEDDTLGCSSTSDEVFYTKQRLLDLDANYGGLFGEFYGSKQRVTEPVASKSWAEVFLGQAQRTKAVLPFVKVAFPELAGSDVQIDVQPLCGDDSFTKSKILHEMMSSRDDRPLDSRVVYDLDQLMVSTRRASSNTVLKNDDLSRVGKMDLSTDHLKFEGRFEGGNLRRATQVGPRHYELLLSPDINQTRPHFQWFYFEVWNNQADVPYTFEIINCLKSTSMFSLGMQPVVYSVTECQQGRPGWARAGSSICYYRNIYTSSSQTNADLGVPKKKKKGKTPSSDTKGYYTTRFELTFHHAADVCYIAYHFPYTYTFLQASLQSMLGRSRFLNRNVYAVSERLCDSLAGNNVPIITITSNDSATEFDQRDVILFFGRVHPGESNSSWMMHGVLDFLLSSNPEAVELREKFIFKLIPMLNPDGVINGCHRCSLAGVDLNRVWDHPSATVHPTVFHTKGIVQYLVEILRKPPLAVVDFHGHSRRFNVFMYGNNPEQSWRTADRSLKHENEFTVLPEILSQKSQFFSYSNCGFGITKGKEPSARVVLWRQFHLAQVFTMEASYCGFDSGSYAGNQVSIAHLKEMGRDLCQSVALLKSRIDAQSRTLSNRVLASEQKPPRRSRSLHRSKSSCMVQC